MRLPIAFLALFPLSLLAQEEKGADQDVDRLGTLKLADGVVLDGTPEGFDDDHRLRWQVSHLIDPLFVPLSSIVEVRLPGASNLERDDAHRALLHLNNGDIVPGQLEALTDDHIIFKTAYAGTLKVKRPMASRIEILDKGTLYTGPNDLKNWTIHGEPDAWTFVSNSLRSTKGASIARELATPDRCRIGLDVKWRTTARFIVNLFSDDGKTARPGSCYQFYVQRQFVYLRKRWVTGDTDGSKILGQTNNPALMEKNSVRLEFYIDRKAGTIALYLDGRQVEHWTDPDPKQGSFGKWFHIVSEDFYPLEISRICLSPWKDEMPPNVAPEDDLPNGDEESDVFRLRSGTVRVGKLTGIHEGLLHIQSKTGDVKLPVNQLSTIHPFAREYEEPVRKKGDIRAWTGDGGPITFRLDSFGKKTLKGYNQNYGDAEFKLDAFTRLEFNVYDEDLDKHRDAKSPR